MMAGGEAGIELWWLVVQSQDDDDDSIDDDGDVGEDDVWEDDTDDHMTMMCSRNWALVTCSAKSGWWW